MIVVGYPAVDNPEDPGEYEVEVRLNGERTATGTVTIE
ncbi:MULTISPECIES: FimD/PapC N-terminal domain-containing protein [Haloplanus]|nr:MULTISPECIES: FimD/PapC N-terminal domain-containing protein [Haloplanus]